MRFSKIMLEVQQFENKKNIYKKILQVLCLKWKSYYPFGWRIKC